MTCLWTGCDIRWPVKPVKAGGEVSWRHGRLIDIDGSQLPRLLLEYLKLKVLMDVSLNVPAIRNEVHWGLDPRQTGVLPHLGVRMPIHVHLIDVVPSSDRCIPHYSTHPWTSRTSSWGRDTENRIP